MDELPRLQPILADIVSIHEIAERLGVATDTVHKWRWRDIMPAPDYPLVVGPVWEWSTIEAWAQATLRLPVR